MLGVALALIVVGIIVLFLYWIVGAAFLAVGLILLVFALIARARRAATESGSP
jgi:hypothetical protein